MQVLKSSIRKRIADAALNQFYKKGYRGAKLLDIAFEADVAVALIYNYFKCKASLFDYLVENVEVEFIYFLRRHAETWGKNPELAREVAEETVVRLVSMGKPLVLLLERSQGTKHEGAREKIVQLLSDYFDRWQKQELGDLALPEVSKLMALMFLAGVMNIAQQDKDEAWTLNCFQIFWKSFQAAKMTYLETQKASGTLSQ